MSVIIPVIAANGARSTVTLPDPIISDENSYPNPGIWTRGGTLLNTWNNAASIPFLFNQPSRYGPIASYTNRDGSGVTDISTPYGAGLQFVCTDYCESNWDSNCKSILISTGLPPGTPSADPVGSVVQYSTHFYMPTQTFPTTDSRSQYGFFVGLIWEFHGPNNNNTFLIDVTSKPYAPTPTWRVQMSTEATMKNMSMVTTGIPVVFDTWHKLDVQVYWSASNNGYMKWYLNNQLIAGRTGATYFDGPNWVQYGFYSGKGNTTNTVRFGPLTRTRFASLGS